MNFCIERYLRIKSSPINAIWFIKTNFLEAILKNKNILDQVLVQYSSFRSFYPCGLSKLKKELRGCQRGAYTCMTTCMNHEATALLYT